MEVIDEVRRDVHARSEHEPEFLQAVDELLASLKPLFASAEASELKNYATALRLVVDPERVIIFRVVWEADDGELRVNRGWRVQFNSALGAYKGGLRFHPTVTLSVLKFLGFEQIYKNALTGLPMGGGKGGSDFDPKGKSDAEVRRFCQSFMTELQRHIGPDTDVPAGDIGVGAREIGFLFGQYKRLRNATEGALTGKGLGYGGIHLRPEATGYGVVYIAVLAMQDLAGRRCVVSGAGNVAQFCAAQLLKQGALVLSLSDSGGALVKPDGFSEDDLAYLRDLKNARRARLSEAKVEGASYVAGSVWALVGAEGSPLPSADLAFPCATQNEIDGSCAARMVGAGGVRGVFEGANMPSTAEAMEAFRAAEGVVFMPAKAANAGGVGVSGLEMAQNKGFVPWTAERADGELRRIMGAIYHEVKAAAERVGRHGDFVVGANVAGFLRVATAMKEMGFAI